MSAKDLPDERKREKEGLFELWTREIVINCMCMRQARIVIVIFKVYFWCSKSWKDFLLIRKS